MFQNVLYLLPVVQSLQVLLALVFVATTMTQRTRGHEVAVADGVHLPDAEQLLLRQRILVAAFHNRKGVLHVRDHDRRGRDSAGRNGSRNALEVHGWSVLLKGRNVEECAAPGEECAAPGQECAAPGQRRFYDRVGDGEG